MFCFARFKDVIPENRRFNLRTYEKGTELELEEHDINDICSSSYDPKYPPSSNLLNQNSNKIGWMSGKKRKIILFDKRYQRMGALRDGKNFFHFSFS